MADVFEGWDAVAVTRDCIPFTGHILDTGYVQRVAFAVQAADGGRLELLAGDMSNDLRKIAQYQSETAFSVDMVTGHLPRFIAPRLYRQDSDTPCMLYVYRYQVDTEGLTFGLEAI